MRVLIADDESDTADALAVLIQSWGYEAIVAHDGPTALALVQAAETPILALLDWIMPGMNGIDVCREIRKDSTRPYSYVMLMTGAAGKEQLLDGLEAGADDYLIKPLDASELHARLNTGKRILRLQEQLLETQRLLRGQAARDSLTGLWNRAMILEILHREMARSHRSGQPLAIMMADLDHFKNVNDTHGHLVGDQVLRQAGQRLLAELRPYDTVGRYGGEEFLVVLPGCDAGASLVLAERLRRCVEAEPIQADDVTVHLTVSLGLAVWEREGTAQVLLQTADRALYRAKAQGRNRVLAGEVPGTG